MSEAVRTRFLEPFFTTKGERGTGLGLAMVYGMTVRHEARLDIDSSPGRGTAIRLTFPSIGRSSLNEPRPAARLTRRLNLLVIEDDPVVLQTLKRMLEQDGHVVLAVDGGQAGIDAFARAQSAGPAIDMVITDLGMPVVDGRTVAAAIKRRSATTPVILLTGWGHRMLDDKDLPMHVDRVLSKPPQLAQLRMALLEFSNASAVPSLSPSPG